jgi:hypothetical protein
MELELSKEKIKREITLPKIEKTVQELRVYAREILMKMVDLELGFTGSPNIPMEVKSGGSIDRLEDLSINLVGIREDLTWIKVIINQLNEALNNKEQD